MQNVKVTKKSAKRQSGSTKCVSLSDFMDSVPVIYVRSPRARRLSIRILSSGVVKVTYPFPCPKSRAQAFLQEQLPWVRRHLEKQQAVPAWPLLEGDTRRTVLERAKAFLPERIAALSARVGLPFQGLTLRYMTSRYGSCSARKHITLNTALVLLPRPLADSVILHELCHTRHMDHGPAFHRLLEEKTRQHFSGYTEDPYVQDVLSEAARSRAAYPLTHTLRKRLIARRLPVL